MGSPAAQPSANDSMDIGLRSSHFLGLLWTHGFTVASFVALFWLGVRCGGDFAPLVPFDRVLSICVAVFFVPYVLFAWLAGYCADHLEKRKVILAAKMAELTGVLLTIGAFHIRSWPLVLCALGWSGAAKALYDAGRFALVGQWFSPTNLVRANGGLWIVGWIGATVGFFISEKVYSLSENSAGVVNLVLAAILLAGLVLVGGLGIFSFVRTSPESPSEKFPRNGPLKSWSDVRSLVDQSPLLRMALGVVLFWAFIAIGLMNISRFAAESNGITSSLLWSAGVYLTIGVIVGGILVGLASIGRVELGLVPWGALIAIVGLLLLATSSSDALIEFGTGQMTLCSRLGLVILGLGASFFFNPMVAYFQQHADGNVRGSLFSAMNILVGLAIPLGVWLSCQTQSPVRDGSFSNLPAECQLSALSNAKQQVVNDALQALEISDASDTTKSLDTKLDELKRAVRLLEAHGSTESAADGSSGRKLKLVGLTQLLWKHLKARQLAGESFREQDYVALFPEDQDAGLVVKFVMAQIARQPRMSARQVLFVLSLLAIPIFLYAMMRVPQAMARLPLWWAFRSLYRVQVNGVENIPVNGGAVLVINHSSWIDGLIILLMSARRIRMFAWAGNFNNRVMKFLARFAQVILITGGPKSIQKGLSDGRKALQRGELVGIFPEGGITRTGQVREFRPGLMKMLDQMPVPIVPVYIDQIWGSIFTYSGGRSLWKIPKTFRHRITINIGPPTWRPETIYQVRQAVLEEGAAAVNQRQPPFVCPAQMFIRACKKRRFKSKIADSIGQELTGGMLLTRSLILRDLLRRHVLPPDEKNVGVLIPPSTGGVIANMSLSLDHRVAVHLNYTLSERLINECIRIAEIKHVLTTRKVMEKFNFNLQADVVYLDDLKDKVTSTMKLAAMFKAFVTPARWVESSLGIGSLSPDELLTVIFTSGSTGIPKGVMLSQRNIASNVEAIGQVICLSPKDTIIGVLPFFHSFGYMATLWGAMALDVRGAYHFSPLEAIQIGKLTRTYHGTVLLGTPTFLRMYLRKCTRDDFASVNTVVAGAEKLPAELCVAFDHRFGVRPVEGYGTTELSPLVSVNVPPSRTSKSFQSDNKEGSVGRPVPNVVAKITDLDDPTRNLGPNQSGMLWVKGPNVMLGYMHRPDLTNEVIVDGWYCTGDVGQIDNEGFITLTGRMSRFSKIGGEMVPHIQIEETLNSILSDPDSDEQKIVVTAVPDAKKGERLVVLHTPLERTPADLCQRLRETGLPNLYVPSEDSFFQVDAIPVLGSGKLDLKRMKELGLQLTGQGLKQ